MNIENIAVQVGDLLKYDVYVKDIDRTAQAVLGVRKRSFPHAAISSERAQCVYDWVMSFAAQSTRAEGDIQRLAQFCTEMAPDSKRAQVAEILERNGCAHNLVNKDTLNDFLKREYHPEVVQHSKKLFMQGNYFHAVFEAVKCYNYTVKGKSQSDKDGVKLMMEAFNPKGVLKLNTGQTETERNVQEGIMFLSSGLMQAVRNPTAHEPALVWSIEKQDCLDLLSMISFLFRQLDKATYYNSAEADKALR